jgi:hypothetical protein
VKRRLFNLLAAVSLVLCAAALAIWVRSYWSADRASWTVLSNHPTYVRCTCITSANGGVQFLADKLERPGRAGLVSGPSGFEVTRAAPSNYPFFTWHSSVSVGVAQVHLKRLGFELFLFESTAGATFHRVTSSLTLPHCAIAAALASVSFVCWRLRATKDSSGKCRTCGYDLRASKDRCPECGTTIPAAPPRGNL